jgi:hypothetical protein
VLIFQSLGKKQRTVFRKAKVARSHKGECKKGQNDGEREDFTDLQKITFKPATLIAWHLLMRS